MAWVTLQLSDVESRLSSDEIAAITARSSASNPVQMILTRVTDFVRGYVANQTALDAEGTIPDKLVDAALDIFVVRFLTIVPSGKALVTAPRQRAYDDAIDLLKAVAKGMFRVEPAVTPAAEQPPPRSPSPSISRGPRRVGRGRGIGRYEEGA